ncbi:MAG TPA: triphosphoribosyl-dephospho-CoA synthase [Myxococcales bacterium]|nr:triphosphoribosyl-dephospho-CoA synthase [Myxococcales bacterium]
MVEAAVANLACEALVEEPGVWPRFGLVGPGTAGSHDDMDYGLLVRSAAALHPHFEDSARLGLQHPGDAGASFQLFRRRGVIAEREMFQATGGVNTHKGAIFMLGLLGHAWARLQTRRLHEGWPGRPSATAVLDEAFRAAAPSMRRELRHPHAGFSQTYGEWALIRHGWRGIRGAVLDGFATLRRAFHWLLRHRHLARARALGFLRHYFFATSEDTNLLKRAGHDRARELLLGSRRLLAQGSVLHPGGARNVMAFERLLLRQRLSGAAAGDLVAALLFLTKLHEHGHLAAA